MKSFKQFSLILLFLTITLPPNVRADEPLPVPLSQIAILLPLSGPFADSGQAVLNGFLGSYYLALANKQLVPSISIYDTNQHDVVAVYKQAVASGASLVIGPLLKSDVDQLKKNGDIEVTTIALNYAADSDSSPNNFYQFAISPDVEAQSAAQLAYNMGLRQALTISPEGDWGNHIVSIFNQTWQTNGGTIVNSATYTSDSSLNDAVSTLLNINQSQWRKIQLQRLLGQSLNYSPRRRQDFDVIFLNAPNSQAREIVPLLRFYYAGNIPIYATSIVYDGVKHSNRDNDLNGVQFPIIPWAIQPDANAQKLRKNFEDLYAASFKTNNYLYAFGTDAYALIKNLGVLKASPDARFLGNTGNLFLDDKGRIQHELLWARFVNGAPQLMPIIPNNTLTNENSTAR